jgi:hypothetical protein
MGFGGDQSNHNVVYSCSLKMSGVPRTDGKGLIQAIGTRRKTIQQAAVAGHLDIEDPKNA